MTFICITMLPYVFDWTFKVSWWLQLWQMTASLRNLIPNVVRSRYKESLLKPNFLDNSWCHVIPLSSKWVCKYCVCLTADVKFISVYWGHLLFQSEFVACLIAHKNDNFVICVCDFCEYFMYIHVHLYIISTSRYSCVH